MSDLLSRIGMKLDSEIQDEVYAIAPRDYGLVATQSTAKAADYYSAALSGCAVTEFVNNYVVTDYTPLAPLTDFIPTFSRGNWLQTLEVRKRSKPSLSSVLPACCGIKPQGQQSNNSLLQYHRVSIGTGFEICDLEKWAAKDSRYAIDLEKEAIQDRMEALLEVEAIIAIRGGYGLRGIVGNPEFPAVYLPQPISSMGMSGRAIFQAILSVIRHTDMNYTPPGGFTLALPPAAYRALDTPYSDLHPDSLRSVLLGTCSCKIPGIQTGIVSNIVMMSHLLCAAPGVGSGDIGLLYVPEFLEWDLSVPYQTIEPDRCGLISIGALVANVGEVVQKRQGFAVKIFNV